MPHDTGPVLAKERPTMTWYSALPYNGQVVIGTVIVLFGLIYTGFFIVWLIESVRRDR